MCWAPGRSSANVEKEEEDEESDSSHEIDGEKEDEEADIMAVITLVEYVDGTGTLAGLLVSLCCLVLIARKLATLWRWLLFI